MSSQSLTSQRESFWGRPVAAAALAREAAVSTWGKAAVVLLLVVWLIPIKTYTLPVPLPFHLEVYRLLILVLLFGLIISIMTEHSRLEAGGLGRPALLLATVAIASVAANIQQINESGLQQQALKSLSFVLGYVIVFVILSSTLRSVRDVEIAITALVGGGTVVAISALIEQHTHYNVFYHLHQWIPFLQLSHERSSEVRLGSIRIRASAQHPIALGVALVMCVPLALYLWRQAKTRARGILWLLAALLTLSAAFATISRTVVVAIIGMTAVGLVLRRGALARYAPLLLVVPLAVPIMAPGALRSLYESLRPKGGLIKQQPGRAGVSGSGRISDLGPGLTLWKESPLVGHSLGTEATRGDDPTTAAQLRSSAVTASQGVRAAVIFDDQYLGTLVALGALGLIAMVWFVWGAVLKTARAAARIRGPTSDIMVACAACCAGFGLSLATFDALAFVQSTLLFFIVAALGLKARSLSLSSPSR